MRTPDQFSSRLRLRSVGGVAPDGNALLARIADPPSVPAGRPRLRIRSAGGWTVVEIASAASLLEHGAIQEIGRQLHRLVRHGCNRLLLNLSGMQSMSCELLGTLAGVYRELQRHHGRLALCGLDEHLRDMIRICHLDGLLATYADLAEALVRDALDPPDDPRAR
jgi:anti-anti-sigma factor